VIRKVAAAREARQEKLRNQPRTLPSATGS